MQREKVRVTIRHLRELKFCSRGSRAWFELHGLDWSKFLREGIAVSELEKIDDDHARMAIEQALKEAER